MIDKSRPSTETYALITSGEPSKLLYRWEAEGIAFKLCLYFGCSDKFCAATEFGCGPLDPVYFPGNHNLATFNITLVLTYSSPEYNSHIVNQ